MTKRSAKRQIVLLASTAYFALCAGAVDARAATHQVNVSAESEKGTVIGRVFDLVTGESLRGAIVRVVGGSGQDYTAQDGRYQLTTDAGQIELRIEYVGLDTEMVTVTVPADGSAVADVGLSTGAYRVDDVVVRAAASGQALAINQQKTASGIVNIVSEEVFGQMPDGNIGTALQRLPGISVDTDQDGSASGINIRGVEGDYNSFQIDGNRVPTSGGGRAFDTRQLAAGGVTRIEVVKAPTPDRDGDAIGGIINVVSRSAFQRSGREFQFESGGVYSDLPEKWGHEFDLKYSDIFSIGGGDRNLGVSVSLGSYRTNRYSLNRDMDWVQVTPENNPTLGLDQYDQPVWFMEASHWEYSTRVTDTNTINANFDFRTDPFNSFYLRLLYSEAERSGISYETDIDIDTRFQDAVGGRKTYSELTPDHGRGTAGSNGSRGSRGWIGTDSERENQLYSVNFGGRHEGSNSLLTYDAFYSRNRETGIADNELNFVMKPTSPYLTFEYDLIDVSRGEVNITQLTGDPTDLSLVTAGNLILNASVKTEELFGGRIDWERSFEIGSNVLSFKTGAKFNRSAPSFDRVASIHTMDAAFPYADVVVRNDEVLMGGLKYYDVIPANGVRLLLSNPELFELDEEGSLERSNSADYDATEDTSAGYAMATLRAGPNTVVAGVRYEQVDWKNTNYEVSYLGGVPSVVEDRSGDSYGFWLPGIHLRHEFIPNLVIRESYNRSYGRPRLSELTAGRFVNIEGNITDGNSQLKPAVSDNYDAQVEYYTSNGGLYSFGVFYKNISDFSYTQVYNFSVLDANGVPIVDPEGEFEYEVPANGSTAKNYGIELIARQRFGFLPGALRGLSAGMSATFADSEATYPNRNDDRDLPVPGFSKFMFTGTLEWAWRGFNVRGDYRYRDAYIEGLGDSIETDEFFDAEQRVDLEASYAFDNGLKAIATVTNLTDEAQVSYSGYRQFVEDASLTGRKFTFALGYKF